MTAVSAMTGDVGDPLIPHLSFWLHPQTTRQLTTASFTSQECLRFMSDAKTVRRILSAALSLLLAAGTSQLLYGYQEQQAPPPQGTDAAPAPQSPQQIQALVAPIALYPDALVAQVLSAATSPDQVAQAQD